MTSRGTSRRALRLNKSILFVFLAVSLAGTSAGTAPPYAQEGDAADSENGETERELGVLLRGPLIKKGIPFLYPNALPVFYGEYTYRKVKILVYFTEEEIVRSDSWQPFECPKRTLYRLEREEKLLLYFRNENGWSVFFSMPEKIETPCRFIDKFLDRFLYFRSISRDRNIATFPAVLEF